MTTPVPPSSDDQAALERMKSIGQRVEALYREEAATQGPARTVMGDQKGMSQGLRAAAEFVSGVAAGGLLGWLVDRLAGSAPWGLIFFLLIGFGAGLLNLYRSASVGYRKGQ